MVSRDFIDRARHGLYSSRARYGGGVIGACYMVRTFFDGVAVALFVTTLVLIVVTTFVGVWTSNVMERYWGADPRTVVIDEFVGMWIPLLVAPCGKYTWITALVAFGAFRLIDIFKPLGCRKVDQIPGGWGVMLDDVLAGIYALVITYGVCELITWLAY